MAMFHRSSAFRRSACGATLFARVVTGVLAVATLATPTLLLAAPAAAQDENKTKFRLGDHVPPLDGKWAGDHGPDFTDGMVYAVLFFNSRSQGSRKGFLQFWDIQDRYAGQVQLVFFTNEKIGDADAYITNRGVKRGQVPVGADGDKKSWDAWMKATGQSGDLCLFIVDKAKRLVWAGDPGDNDLHRIFTLVLADRYDPISEAKARPALEAARRAGKIRNYRDAYQHYETAIAVNPKLFSNIALEKYKFMVTEARDPKAGAAYGKQLLETYHDDGSALIDLALMIVSDQEIKERDTALAEAAVGRMLSLAAPAPKPSEPSLLSRYATYQFQTGKVKEAVDSQMEAWMIAPESAKAAYKIKLDQFRNALKASEAKAGDSAKDPAKDTAK